MPAEERYEAHWAKCTACKTSRPRRLLKDGVCADDWHDVLAVRAPVDVTTKAMVRRRAAKRAS